MFGFLLKIIILAAVVGGIGYMVVNKRVGLPNPTTLTSELKNTAQNFDFKVVGSSLSSALDNLVTNPESKSPVVMGVKISNESIGKVVDVLQNLPPEQVEQIRTVLCAIPTPESASKSSTGNE